MQRSRGERNGLAAGTRRPARATAAAAIGGPHAAVGSGRLYGCRRMHKPLHGRDG